MDLTEALYGVLFSPVKSLKRISENKIWLSGILVFVIVMAFNIIISQGIAGIDSLDQVMPIPANLIWLGKIIGILFSIIFLFITTGLYTLLGDIIYKSSNPAGMLASLSFASIPAIFAAPIQYVAILINLNIISLIVSPLIGIWVLILQVLAIRESLRLSTSQAVVLYIIPIIASILIVGMVLAMITSTLLFYK